MVKQLNSMVMKKYLYVLLCLASLIFYGCGKYELENPAFEVTADKTIVKVGEEINFKFEGNPPIFYFYSGQFLNDYEQNNVLEHQNVFLSFESTTASGTQDDQLDVLISNDFNGNYQIDDIRAANWTRITDEFTLATNSTRTPSTEVDLLDKIDPKKPLYIAFRYTTKDQFQYGGQRNWNIYDILLTTQLGRQQLPVVTYPPTSSFGMYSYGNKQEGRSVRSASGLLFKGNSTSSLQSEYTEDWAVSIAINLDPEMIAVNKSIPLKLFTEARKENYVFAYDEPGTYKATFVGETNNVYGNKKVVKTIDITVNP